MANINQANPDSGGALKVVRTILQNEGFGGFWKGLGISLILSLNPALMFTLVDKITALAKAVMKKSAISAGEMFQISAFAKMIATLLTYPLIRTKTIMQTQSTTSLASG